MPIYEYVCRECGNLIEQLQALSDPPLTDCDACGQAALKRKMSAAAFRLSGGGWYETDFKQDGRRNIAGDGDKSESKSETGKDDAKGDGGKSDAKPDKGPDKSPSKSQDKPPDKSPNRGDSGKSSGKTDKPATKKDGKAGGKSTAAGDK